MLNLISTVTVTLPWLSACTVVSHCFVDVELVSQPCGISLDLAAGCETESNCPLLSSVAEVSASVQEEACPPLPGKA